MNEEEIKDKIREKEDEIRELRGMLPYKTKTRGDPVVEVDW